MGTLRPLWVAAVLAACGPTVLENGGDDDGKADGPCRPGTNRACYDGTDGTQGVGPCKGGSQTCDANGSWGACQGQIVPKGETCGNSVDDNCNGMVDENVDADGDGFTTCGGDCCDSTECDEPSLVNGGAFEAAGNSVDDDCDGAVDNSIAASCDTGLASNSGDAFDYARALDLCQRASAADRKWGVISAQLVLPSGGGVPNAAQRAIRPGFGATQVQMGSSFVVLSTGTAAAPGQTNPGHVPFQGGYSLGVQSTVPSDWLMKNGGVIPNAPGCPASEGGGAAHDAVMLELKIRAPTNAKSFKLSTNFLSSEYPEWTCSPFNDFFVVLLDSQWAGTPANPVDKNLAVYTSPTNAKYPVGVNLAHGNTGLFTVCQNGPTGCADRSIMGSISTCMSNAGLVGTGMDVTNPPTAPDADGQPGWCGSANQAGGGTGWLVTQGNVKGGEEITLRIAVWDTSDGIYDSVSLIDGFEWSIETATPGTVIY